MPDSKLDQGVTEAWLLLTAIGVGLLALSVVISAQLSRSLLMPLAAVARASELLADGDLSARAPARRTARGTAGEQRAEPACGQDR